MKKINLIFFLILFLASSNSYAEKWHINMKKKEKKDFAYYVLKAQSDNKMVFNTRNIKIIYSIYKKKIWFQNKY